MRILFPCPNSDGQQLYANGGSQLKMGLVTAPSLARSARAALIALQL
jgi:hypothetical protein